MEFTVNTSTKLIILHEACNVELLITTLEAMFTDYKEYTLDFENKPNVFIYPQITPSIPWIPYPQVPWVTYCTDTNNASVFNAKVLDSNISHEFITNGSTETK